MGFTNDYKRKLNILIPYYRNKYLEETKDGKDVYKRQVVSVSNSILTVKVSEWIIHAADNTQMSCSNSRYSVSSVPCGDIIKMRACPFTSISSPVHS